MIAKYFYDTRSKSYPLIKALNDVGDRLNGVYPVNTPPNIDFVRTFPIISNVNVLDPDPLFRRVYVINIRVGFKHFTSNTYQVSGFNA